MDIHQLLQQAQAMGASDVHLSYQAPPMLRLNGELTPYGDRDARQIRYFLDELMDEGQRERLAAGEDLDFAFLADNSVRCRVHIYKQQDSPAAAIRLFQEQIPTIDELGLPPVLKELSLISRGLVLVTGPAGSGKSTTLAAMVDYINTHRHCHILTIEDPIEYQHRHKLALVSQRQLGTDIADYRLALRSALREDPDVLMIGEMRDEETISAALTAAETGHLVLSTLHTISAAKAIERIVSSVSPDKQSALRGQLANVLQAVVTQILLPRTDANGRIAAVEVMVATDAISNLIRENKIYQIPSAIQTGARLGMRTLDSDLAHLVASGQCRLEDAQAHALNQADFQRFLQNSGQGF